MEKDVNKMLEELIDNMATIAHQVDELLSMGYDQQFELIGNKLINNHTHEVYYPRDLSVDYVFRVDDIGYVFGISTTGSDKKGIFVAYTCREFRSLKFL